MTEYIRNTLVFLFFIRWAFFLTNSTAQQRLYNDIQSACAVELHIIKTSYIQHILIHINPSKMFHTTILIFCIIEMYDKIISLPFLHNCYVVVVVLRDWDKP